MLWSLQTVCGPDGTDSDLDVVAMDRRCHPKTAAIGLTAAVDAQGQAFGGERTLPSIATQKQMDQHARFRLKLTHRGLRDAVLVAGLDVSGRPSSLNNYRVLHLQFGDAQVGFLMQFFHIHTSVSVAQV